MTTDTARRAALAALRKIVEDEDEPTESRITAAREILHATNYGQEEGA